MKKMLRFAMVLVIALISTSFAQVLADFEDGSLGTMGFSDGDWGSGVTSIERIDDPTGTTGGVLAVNINTAEAGNDPVMLDNYVFPGNEPILISYDIWLPADCPDHLLLKVFTQDEPAWDWKDVLIYTENLPKETWWPVVFDMRLAELNGTVYETKISRLGIEFDTREITGSIDFSGQILMDNIKLLGAEPDVYADFEDSGLGTYGFADGNWGTAVTGISSADGAMVIDVNAEAGSSDAIMANNITQVVDADAMTFDLFLPADTPDSLVLQIFFQDGDDWTWRQKDLLCADIAKDTWSPVYFSIQELVAQGDDYSEKANVIGIQVGAWSLTETWTGQIKIDNIAFVSAETGAKWVLADWEAELAGPYFEVGHWGSDGNGISTFERREDPTGESTGILFSSWTFTAAATDPKDAFFVTPVDLGWSETEQGATAIAMDFYVPADFPVESIEVGYFVQDIDWGWWSQAQTVVAGQWNTISIDLVANAEALKLTAGNPQRVGIQLYGAVDWTGDIYIDNFEVLGIEAPDAELHAPDLVATLVDAEFTTGKQCFNTHLQWDDSNQPGLETWDIYMSENPINSLDDEGVIKIANAIPHGEGHWAHRPWTPTGSAKTFYYAIIGVMPEESTELAANAIAGPIEFATTSIPAKATYDPDFSSVFTLDGMDTEFTDTYKAHMMVPEGAGSDSSTGWTLESADGSFKNTFVTDGEYLYMSADVTDDDVITESGVSASWQGDALEFFISGYGINTVTDAWHGKGSVNQAGTGDHRYAYTAWGEIELDGYQVVENYPGVEFVIYQKWGGDGFIIESRIKLDSLATDGTFEFEEGMMLPLKIDCNDRDPKDDDDTRTLQTSWGGVSADPDYAGNSESWLRPSCWGYLMLGDAQTAIDNDEEVAGKFELQDNYPNPFNPTTNIKFQTPASGTVKLAIYDMLGNKIKTIVNEKRSAGLYNVQWDGTNDLGVSVSSGVYFYKLTSNNHVATKKMMFIK